MEISLQPWNVFKPDGVRCPSVLQFIVFVILYPFDSIAYFIFLHICLLLQVILFSDILTPLAGMNIPFDIVKGKGPIIFNPLGTAADVDEVREFVPEDSVPYVGEALTILRKEV